jgi:hypothetical protein
MKLISILILTTSNLVYAGDRQKNDFISLTYSPACILEAVSKKFNVKLRDDVPLPELFPHSTISIDEFKIAVRSNYPAEMNINFFNNMYLSESNAIYVNNKRPFVGENGRTPDDILAHELTHYLQSKYRNYTFEQSTSDDAENSAALIQSWFRDKFMSQRTDSTPCPLSQVKGVEYSDIWKW